MNDNTEQQIILDNLTKVALWAKDVIVIPKPNLNAMLNFTIRYSIAFGLGVGYAWGINPVSYVGANILDMPVNTQLPIVLGLSKILYAVRTDAYSVGKVIEVINDLGISNSMFCETQNLYLSFTDIMNYVTQILGVSC